MTKQKQITFYNNYPHAGRQASEFMYFGIGRHWNSRIKEIFESDVVQAQLFHDFNKYAKFMERRVNKKGSVRRSQGHVTYSYNQTDKPICLDLSDWRCERIGRPYSFDEYVCNGACHTIVNSLLLTARIAFPDRPWIIVSSVRHSTVWDQCVTFFDMNWLALNISATYCAISTVFNDESDFLKEGELLELV